jgi:CheY-like chemotaxis protein
LQARVFQEFHRSQFTATGTNDGLGLGLSIVQRYAQLLGIMVKFKTRQGRGTRFTLKIPDILVGETSDEPANMSGAAICRLKNQRILVLDDEPLIVEALARDLTDRGNTVLRATSPAEAEQKIAMLGYPDIAVVDIDLTGDESGPDFITRIEAQFGRRLPTLILTGATDAETLAGLIASGRPWLTKPADPDAISRVLAGLAAGRGSGSQPDRSTIRDGVEPAMAS